MKEHYQEAVLSLIHAGESPAKVLDGLKSTLKARGHQALLPSILASVLRTLEATGTKSAQVSVAQEADLATHKKAIADTLQLLDVKDHDVVIDDTLIGGFVVTGNDQTVNRSYKHLLTKLYRQLTS